MVTVRSHSRIIYFCFRTDVANLLIEIIGTLDSCETLELFPHIHIKTFEFLINTKFYDFYASITLELYYTELYFVIFHDKKC